MKKKNEKQMTQEETRLKLENDGWKFKKDTTDAVCPNQLRLTVNDAYMYAYPSMQLVWNDLCVAMGLEENYELHPRTTYFTLPDGIFFWRLLAYNKDKQLRFYEHKLCKCRIDKREK
jgi:hypothetical protein